MLFYQLILEVVGVVEGIVADVTIVIFPVSCLGNERVVFYGHMAMKCCRRFTFILTKFSVKTGGRKVEMLYLHPGWRTTSSSGALSSRGMPRCNDLS